MADTKTETEKQAPEESAGAKKPAKPRKAARAKAVEEAGRSYFDAISARDPDAMASHFHPQGIEDIVPLGVFRGPAEVRALFTELFAATTTVPRSRARSACSRRRTAGPRRS